MSGDLGGLATWAGSREGNAVRGHPEPNETVLDQAMSGLAPHVGHVVEVVKDVTDQGLGNNRSLAASPNVTKKGQGI